MGIRTVEYRTSEELAEAGEAWKDRLGLKEWDISWNLSPELVTEGKHGTCAHVLEQARAFVSVAPMIGIEHDQEETLVHELLHLYFLHVEPKDGSHEHRMMEQSVDRLSRAIVAMQRSKGLTLGDLA